MAKIHEIHVKDDEVTIIFDEDAKQEKTYTRDILLAAINEILADPIMTDQDRTAVLDMPLHKFCELLQNGINPMADEPTTKPIGAPKLEVIRHPENYICPYCGVKGRLKVVDGHLACYACNVSYGDVDELPDMI